MQQNQPNLTNKTFTSSNINEMMNLNKTEYDNTSINENSAVLPTPLFNQQTAAPPN